MTKLKQLVQLSYKMLTELVTEETFSNKLKHLYKWTDWTTHLLHGIKTTATDIYDMRLYHHS